MVIFLHDITGYISVSDLPLKSSFPQADSDLEQDKLPIGQVHLVQLQSPTHDLVYKLRFAVSEPLLTHGDFRLLGCVFDRRNQLLVLLVLLGVLANHFGHY